jgi:hypothetical protein
MVLRDSTLESLTPSVNAPLKCHIRMHAFNIVSCQKNLFLFFLAYKALNLIFGNTFALHFYELNLVIFA